MPEAEITDTEIYTTGAFLRPMKVPSNHSETGWVWRWVVTEFTDDSFTDGDIYNPAVCAYTGEELLINTTEELLEDTAAGAVDYCEGCRKLGKTTCAGTRNGCWEAQ